MRKFIIVCAVTTAITLGGVTAYQDLTPNAVASPQPVTLMENHESRIPLTVAFGNGVELSYERVNDLAIDPSHYPTNSTFVLGWTIYSSVAHSGAAGDPFATVCADLGSPAIGTVCSTPIGPSGLSDVSYESAPLTLASGMQVYHVTTHATSSDPNSHTAVYGSISLIARWTTSSASVGGIAEQPALHASVAGHGRLPYAPALFVLVAVVGFADGRTAAQRG